MSLTSYRTAPPRVNLGPSDPQTGREDRGGEREEGIAGLAATYSSAAGAAVPLARRVFTAEFGMGSGVWPLAMATRLVLAKAGAGKPCPPERPLAGGRPGVCHVTRSAMSWMRPRRSLPLA